MRWVLGLRRFVGLTTLAGAVAALLLATGSVAFANTPTTGAAFTTVNEGVDGSGHCQNGNPAVNCNIYDGKQYVWLNGGPSVAYVGDGTYFFAVLDPGGQADPNDGSAKNLSSPNDPYTNRTFSVAGGVVSYNGSHNFDSNKIRLMTYDDTSNPGGVYIMAICSLANGYPVKPSSCKYDAFKVQEAASTPTGFPLTITKDANGADNNTFSWTIAKDVDKTKVVNASGSATFTYTVTVTHDGGTISDVKVTGTIAVFNPNVDSGNNTLGVAISGITDTLSDGKGCTVTGGGPQTLTQFETDFAYTCDLASLPQGQLDNTATVDWPDQTLSDGSSLAAGSATFMFSNIAFDESKVDDCVNVTDTLGGTLGAVCSTKASPITFTYSNTVTGTSGTCVSQDNTATYMTNTTGTTGSASKGVQMCTPADLKVTKTAAPAFTRTYNWRITKAVDKTVIRTSGSTATFNYTIVASETGFTDSGWKVTGSITVSNPNDFEAIALSGVVDSIDNGGSCSVTGDTTTPIAASGSRTLGYSCTYASKPAYGTTFTNTATANWDAGTAATPDGSASGTATGQFGNPTTRVNQMITVNDSLQGLLGTVTATDTTPYASRTFTYSRTVTIDPNGCKSVDNTASIVETSQTASQSVKACPTVTGLTIGFWANKNGQALISGGASTGGVCNSASFLRQYAPFQDLSATATCSQVATYVYNVIKGGGTTCGTSSCNAMLKAQMLATALNVFFNKTNGSEQIDLVNGCKMIDSSTLTATCGGAENWSPAFGGATHMTVLQMLAYAAAQSNVGGSVWYSQVKATQVLAKDAFDAINNGVALAY